MLSLIAGLFRKRWFSEAEFRLGAHLAEGSVLLGPSIAESAIAFGPPAAAGAIEFDTVETFASGAITADTIRADVESRLAKKTT